jgi:chromosome partitioning protein
MSKVIACAAHKGGVGKTVTAMAVAAAFARAGDATLLVDIDPQGHSTIGLGVEFDPDALTVRDIYTEPPVEPTRTIVGTSVPQLSMMPATIRLERVAHSLYMRPRREDTLAHALRPLRALFKWVIIDCPPSLGALTETAIAAADLVIVPCRMEARASDGLIDLLELMALLRGEHFGRWKILMTQVDKRKSTTNAAVAAALSRWDAHLLDTVIPQSEPLNQAQIARVDCFAYNPTCSGSAAYLRLAQELSTLLCRSESRVLASSI